jgi:Domain of unknown function (DUF4386)
MNEKKTTLKKTARTAGFLYLIVAISGGYGIMYVPTQLIVTNDLTSTTNNILNNEFLFRTGIMSNLICQTVFIFLVLTLYRLFEQVDKLLARTMISLAIAAVPIAFLIIFNQLYALLLLKEGFMKTFEPAQVHLLTMSYLKMYDYGNSVIGIFWGLWLIPFGQLVFKSGLIPKILGILLIIGGLTYVLDSFTYVLFPGFHSMTSTLVGITSSIAEISMILWFLIKGVNDNKDTAISNTL